MCLRYGSTPAKHFLHLDERALELSEAAKRRGTSEWVEATRRQYLFTFFELVDLIGSNSTQAPPEQHISSL